MGQKLASEQSEDHGWEKLVEMFGYGWEGKNSQSLQLTGNPVSLFLSSS